MPVNGTGHKARSVEFAHISWWNFEGARGMVDYLIAVVLFVFIVTTLVFLWKREH